MRSEYESVVSASAQFFAVRAGKCELAGEALRNSGTLCLRATGHSMVPTIWPGDLLTIRPASVHDFETGDIVLFRSRERFVAHRVVTTMNTSAGPRVQTQGDSVACADFPISEGDVLGKVAFIERNGKCMGPVRGLGKAGRAIAGLFRRSQLAARVVVGVHGMRRS